MGSHQGGDMPKAILPLRGAIACGSHTVVLPLMVRLACLLLATHKLGDLP